MTQENSIVPSGSNKLALSPGKNPVLDTMVRDALAHAREQTDLVTRDNLPSATPSAYTIPWLGLELMPIPAGEFLMGSPDDEDLRRDNETQHQVTISKPFWMGKYPVTQGQWETVTGYNPSYCEEAGKDAPVECVNWEDAMEFCRKVNLREAREGRLPQGYEFTLPTEAQWEYACRAGTTTVFHFGDSLSSHQANFDGNHPYGDAEEGPFLDTTTPVGKYRPNAWGLYDMHGNVWEWCHDWFGDYPSGSVTDPAGPNSGTGRVFRGGSWLSDGEYCRSANRDWNTPGNRNVSLGFRPSLRVVTEKA
jgi:formylglycine-generating enzyme required for sulfatase activity